MGGRPLRTMPVRISQLTEQLVGETRDLLGTGQKSFYPGDQSGPLTLHGQPDFTDLFLRRNEGTPRIAQCDLRRRCPRKGGNDTDIAIRPRMRTRVDHAEAAKDRTVGIFDRVASPCRDAEQFDGRMIASPRIASRVVDDQRSSKPNDVAAEGLLNESWDRSAFGDANSALEGVLLCVDQRHAGPRSADEFRSELRQTVKHVFCSGPKETGALERGDPRGVANAIFPGHRHADPSSPVRDRRCWRPTRMRDFTVPSGSSRWSATAR